MYFTEKEVKEIFSKIATSFPRSEMLFKAIAPFMVKCSDKHPDVKYYDANSNGVSKVVGI